MDKLTNTCLHFDDIMNMEQRKRANLINSIGGFKSVCLIGTTNNENQTNLAIFNSLVHIGANPPLIGFFVRPDSVERHTLANILNTEYYTINHINEAIYKQAHQTAARYEKEVSEFEATQLTPEFKDNFKAPFVQESFIQLGVQLKEKITIQSNQTILLIGEIKLINFPTNCMENDGFINLEKAQTITCSGLDSYYKTTKIARLSYAKPNSTPTII
jgi:flavin reductase (DIM6/NTAB) family NADH-FMN oxidoreductase RutF